VLSVTACIGKQCIQIRKKTLELLNGITYTRDETGRDFHDLTRPVTLLLNQPLDRQHCRLLTGQLNGKITFRSDIATPNRKKTAMCTTVRLHCVDKCRLSLHYHILIKCKNGRLYKKWFSGCVLEKVSICILSRWPVTHRSCNVNPGLGFCRQKPVSAGHEV